MEKHYRELDTIVKEHKTSARIRFMIIDLTELRQVSDLQKSKLFFFKKKNSFRLHGLLVVLKQNQQQSMKFMNKNV